jgi:hypothetical protein
MRPEEVTALIKQVLAEQKVISATDIDPTSLKTIATILTSFGIEDDDRFELKADFSHLRRWRKSVEQAQSYTFKAIITAITMGFLGALWLGIKATVGK